MNGQIFLCLLDMISQLSMFINLVCVSVYCQKDEGVFVSIYVCVLGGFTKLNVSELGAHSLVDLVGIKIKRNVSKL